MIQLTEQERRTIYLEEKAREDAKKELRETKRKEYKNLTDEIVLNVFGILEKGSKSIKNLKSYALNELTTLIELKKDVYEEKFDKIESQYSNTFTSKNGKISITIGQNINDNWDDTVNEGISKVRNFIYSLAKDENTKKLVDTVMRLLSKDKAGNLKASRVLQLQKLAEDYKDEDFLDGVKIIREAYNPVPSSTYIKAFYKDENGVRHNLPLSLTEA